MPLSLINAKVYTQDPATPAATAIAIRDGRFVAVGSDEQILALTPSNARLVDLQGRRVLPGLTDSHVHFYDWAIGRTQLDLEGVTSLAAFCERLAGFAHKTPPRRWIRGYGWNETGWPAGRLPTRHDLDAAAPHNPVLLWRSDLHLAAANSLALQQAAIGAHTPDPEQGVIDRDAAGEPTGILRDLAINLVSQVIPPTDEDQASAAFKDAFKVFHSLGLTGVHDQRLMGAPEAASAFRTWQRLHAGGDIRLRVWMNLPGDRLDEIIRLGLRTGFGDPYFRLGHLKYFVDGAQGPHTAWMLEPYEDAPTTGLPLIPIQELSGAILRAHQAGLAVDVHAIGDRANRELITLFENLQQQPLPPISAPPAAPHKIAHLQIIRFEDVQRLAGLKNAVVSLQPPQVTDDIDMMEPTIGARARFAYPYRSIWETGIPVAFNSDCPVCNPNPFWGIHAAVTRQPRDGSPAGSWHPEQRVSVAQAVWAYTMGAAVASGRQADQGSLSPGKLADLVVIDQDIFDIDPMEIYKTRPVMTVFDGEVVYETG